MNLRKLAGAGAVLAALALAAPANALNFSFTGTFTDPDEEQFFNFSVGASSTVTFLTYSYAGGTNAAGQVIGDGGFDPILAVFDDLGDLIDQNDDGTCSQVGTDATTGQCYDTYLELVLGAGDYSVAVMTYANFALGPNVSDGFIGGGDFTDATGDPRSTFWAFDILNVAQADQVVVPEPAALALFGLGALGLGVLRRRRAA